MAVSLPGFALNHMSAPRLGLAAFLDLAVSLGLSRVEIRNDLQGRPILDGTGPAAVRAEVTARGLSVISINALQRFNEWTPGRAREAAALIDYAAACGAAALVLVPVNDGSGRGDHERASNLDRALDALNPMLAAAGITGLVEPLGFEICSLRRKSEAAAGIRRQGDGAPFRLVHDTFHHHLAGEAELFPALTGLVHISGVDDPAVPVSAMLDAHRVLVGPGDRLDNLGQIRALVDAGLEAPLSFEPFADSVHALADPGAALAASIAFIRSGTGQATA